MSKKAKKEKKKKAESLPKIKRRLFKLWSQAVRDRANNMCEYCSIKNKELNKNNVKTKIDAHHLISRKIKDCPLKFDIRNGIAVDPICHKWGIPSFHRDPITTITWLMKHHPDRYEFVLNNNLITIDLDNRYVLAEIETRLLAKECLDINKLKEIEAKYPRKPQKDEIKGSLFDEDDSEDNDEDDEESSTSSD